TGIKEGQAIARLAKANGSDCMVGSMIEGYAGLAAAAHFALSTDAVRYYDLDVPFMRETKHLDSSIIGMQLSPGKSTLLDKPDLEINEQGAKICKKLLLQVILFYGKNRKKILSFRK